MSKKSKSTKGSDATGYQRGAKGYGELNELDREFLKPDFDREKQQGPLAVGHCASVGDGAKLQQKD